MTTLNDALGKGDARVSIAGTLVCKHMFHKGRLTLLIMLISDHDRQLFEAKTWRRTKAYTVYGKFKEGEHVCLSVNSNDLVEPNKSYTQARCVTVRNSWYLEHAEGQEHPEKAKLNFNYLTSIKRFRAPRDGPAVSIQGSFLAMREGPSKYWLGRCVAQGYYVTLADHEGAEFVALVWKSLTKLRTYKFALDDCALNERVIIVNAREQVEKYRDRLPGQYVVTTIYPPVVVSSPPSPKSSRGTSSQSSQQYAETSGRPYEFCGLAVTCA